VSTPNVRPQPLGTRRRSQRILLSVPIFVSGERANGAPFAEHTKTQVVNAHGALILLREQVLVGQKIRIKNLATAEELLCTVIDIDPGDSSVPEVGLEFSEPCPRFWHVNFPPEDWSPRNPEAKRVSYLPAPATPQSAKK
jgi:hypothetical protein